MKQWLRQWWLRRTELQRLAWIIYDSWNGEPGSPPPPPFKRPVLPWWLR